MSKLLVNLGCGKAPAHAPKTGGTWAVVNHDRVQHAEWVDVAWDLNSLPWPWRHDQVTMLYAISVLEHLHLTLLESVNECWRVLKPGGRLKVKLPLWDVDVSWDDPTHRWHVGRHGLDVFDPTTERGRTCREMYQVQPWRLLEQKTFRGGTSLYGLMEAVK